MALKSDLKVLPNLSPHAFQHPLDRQAMEAMRKIPSLPQFVRFLAEKIAEPYVSLKYIASHLRVSARQYPSLHKQFVAMAQTIDVQKLPELYISAEAHTKVFGLGLDNYSIVVGSALIDLLTDDELLALLAHELGHVKCDHMIYNAAANTLRNFDALIIEHALPMGLGQSANINLQLALLDWARLATLSCDRAALLATQNLEALVSALSKLAGHTKNLNEEINLTEVKAQAEQYQESDEDSLLDRMLKLALWQQEAHPSPVVRLHEITLWAASEAYQNILRGQYKKLGEETKLKLVGTKIDS